MSANVAEAVIVEAFAEAKDPNDPLALQEMAIAIGRYIAANASRLATITVVDPAKEPGAAHFLRMEVAVCPPTVTPAQAGAEI